jgi:hypothetical protein
MIAANIVMPWKVKVEHNCVAPLRRFDRRNQTSLLPAGKPTGDRFSSELSFALPLAGVGKATLGVPAARAVTPARVTITVTTTPSVVAASPPDLVDLGGRDGLFQRRPRRDEG